MAPGRSIACGEALLPAFVAEDPYGAGFAAVLTNVNDLAAMGATPRGIVDTVVGTADLAREALRGMRAAGRQYDVPIVGGHLTLHDGPPAVSAFGIGCAESVLSLTRVCAGQSLIVATCTQGTMRTDFPFFRSFEERGARLAGDVRVLAEVARSGACVAAKDVSMAGLVGSLAMLLEWGRLGVTAGPRRPAAARGGADGAVAHVLPGVRLPAVLPGRGAARSAWPPSTRAGSTPRSSAPSTTRACSA